MLQYSYACSKIVPIEPAGGEDLEDSIEDSTVYQCEADFDGHVVPEQATDSWTNAQHKGDAMPLLMHSYSCIPVHF